MLSKILSYNILSAIDTLSISKLNEIHLRVDKPIIVMYEGKNYYLCQSGITTNKNDAIYSTKNDLQYTLKNASDNSLYAVNNQIVSGYLTIKGGIRIGICGEIVRDQDKIISIIIFIPKYIFFLSILYLLLYFIVPILMFYFLQFFPCRLELPFSY